MGSFFKFVPNKICYVLHCLDMTYCNIVMAVKFIVYMVQSFLSPFPLHYTIKRCLTNSPNFHRCCRGNFFCPPALYDAFLIRMDFGLSASIIPLGLGCSDSLVSSLQEVIPFQLRRLSA